MSKKEVKTNAMRMLDRAKVSYTYEEYECDDFTDGIQTADKLGYDHKLVYKTLVTTGKTGNHYVFVIPIEAEIDFKKAAKVVGEKSLEMLHLKDLTKVTGYVRGGSFHASGEGYYRRDGVCARRLHGDWHEETVSYRNPGRCKRAGIYACQRRKAWNADQACTVRPSKGCKSRICRCDPSITRCGDGVQSICV
mgnify:CR=1 FL=1